MAEVRLFSACTRLKVYYISFTPEHASTANSLPVFASYTGLSIASSDKPCHH